MSGLRIDLKRLGGRKLESLLQDFHQVYGLRFHPSLVNAVLQLDQAAHAACCHILGMGCLNIIEFPLEDLF